HDVVLAHAEETTDTNHNTCDLSRLVDQDFTNVTELFVLLIVDIDAHELRCPPQITVSRSRRSCCNTRRGRLGRRVVCGLPQSRADHHRRKQSTNYELRTHSHLL